MKMRTKLSVLLPVLVLLLAVLTIGATAQAQLPEQCSHCGKAVTWQPLSEVTAETIAAGHYYVDTALADYPTKTVAASTAVCIHMNGSTISGTDRVFNVSGTLTIMGEGTITGRGRDSALTTTNRYGGTALVSTGGVLNLYDATITHEKVEGYSKASNGGNINVYGTLNMYSGAVSNGYASNAGGNIFVNPAGTFNMYGGSITGGTCSAGKSVCAQGKVRLAGDASINHLYLWDKSSAGFDSLLTMEGAYTGTTYIQLRSTTPAEGLVVATADGANLRLAQLDFAGSGLYTKISNGKVVLTAEAPATTKTMYCQNCKETVTWSWLTENNAADTTLSEGHYYLDFLTGTDAWVAKSVSGKVCLDLNGQSLTGPSRIFSVPKGAVLNIQGSGTVAGSGYDSTLSTSNRVGGTILISSGGTLNQYGGELRFNKVTGQNVSNGGVVMAYGNFCVYGGSVSGGQASNAGSNVFVGPYGSLKLYGGQIIAAAKGRPVYCQGSLLLAGDAQLGETYLTYKSGGPAIDAMLTVQGVYTGSALLEMNGLVPEEGSVLGISDGADLRHAGIAFVDTTLYAVVDGDRLKLSGTKPVYTKEGYCEICQKDTTWTALMEDFAGQTNIESGHYYLDFADGTGVWASKIISGAVCLDLNGQTLTGTTRALVVESGSILNLLGDGTVIGRGRASTLDLDDRVGGTVLVEKQAVLNQYGGKLTFEAVDGQSAGNGGVLNVIGTYNLYDGSVENGKSAWVGGNIFVTTLGSLNLYGGTVSGGTASHSGQNIACRGNVSLSGDAVVSELYLYPNTDIGGPALNQMLTVRGKYTGSVKLRASGIANGLDVGTAVDADLSEATVTTTNSSVSGMAVHGSDLILLGANTAVILEGTTVFGSYADLAAAIAAYDSNTKRIVLFGDVEEDVTLTGDVYLDLNGHSITGNVTGEGILYCMDAQTDDFVAPEGDYGTVTATDKVRAVPQGAPCTSVGYLMVEQDGKASFHRIKLRVTAVNLRPGEAGLYYSCSFDGDELVKARVETFGMLVSVEGDPIGVSGDAIVGRTALSGDRFGADSVSTSTMVTGIMKDGNTDETNAANAATCVYGRTYVALTDGSCLYGDLIAKSLADQVCGTAEMVGIERIWDGLSTRQKRGVMDLYAAFETVMGAWDIPTIRGAAAVRDDAAEDVLLARRAQVVAKMRQMGDIFWRATEDVKYHISATARWVEFKAGRIYRGMPYAYARSDQATFLEFAGEPDEKGIYPISGLTTAHLGNGGTYARIGNDCSGSVNFAWSSAGADISGTKSSRYIIEANGYYKVGDYAYTPTEDGRVGISKEIVAANGKETMFEAYAKVQPGDGLDSTAAGGGHVILVVDKHVVYNPDGSIDPERSYIHTLEQTPGPVSITVQQHSYNEELGEMVYDIYIEKNMTFQQVYSSGYLPITVKILTDPTPVAAPSVTDSLSPEAYSYENLLKGELAASRMISSVTLTVTDENGTVFTVTGSGIRASIRNYFMKNFLTEDPAVMRGSLELDKLVAGNDYHCTVVVRLASGDAITVRDFDFTATDADISVPEDTEVPDVTEPEEEEIPDETTQG